MLTPSCASCEQWQAEGLPGMFVYHNAMFRDLLSAHVMCFPPVRGSRTPANIRTNGVAAGGGQHHRGRARKPSNEGMRFPRKRPTALVVFSVGALALIGCSQQHAGPPPSLPVPVAVATVVQKAAPVLLRTIGNVEAYSTVSIKAQVSAALMEVRFREGQFVRKGDLLFILDRRPFDAALHQSEATLAHDRAQAANARVEAQRYEKLWQEGVAPKEQFDQYRTAADALDAAVKADEAAVETAKLNLEYCFIYSPIDGQTSNLMVYPGNLVKANDVPILITINQIQPIYVEFTVPEASLADVRGAMRGHPLTVEVRTQDNPAQPERGVVTFINNQVDTATGTIQLKATFSNPARRLWPGQFVDVMLKLAEQPNAIVIPTQAVQSGQDGTYVYVVRPDGTAESRAVAVARSLDGESVISKGLAPGERVVTDGQLRLVPGAKVSVKSGS